MYLFWASTFLQYIKRKNFHWFQFDGISLCTAFPIKLTPMQKLCIRMQGIHSLYIDFKTCLLLHLYHIVGWNRKKCNFGNPHYVSKAKINVFLKMFSNGDTSFYFIRWFKPQNIVQIYIFNFFYCAIFPFVAPGCVWLLAFSNNLVLLL